MVKIHAATGQKTTAGNILTAVWHTPMEVKGQTAATDETDSPSSIQVYLLYTQYFQFCRGNGRHLDWSVVTIIFSLAGDDKY